MDIQEPGHSGSPVSFFIAFAGGAHANATGCSSLQNQVHMTAVAVFIFIDLG